MGGIICPMSLPTYLSIRPALERIVPASRGTYVCLRPIHVFRRAAARKTVKNSSLLEEPERLAGGPEGVEVVVAAAGEADELLRPGDEPRQPFAEIERHDGIALAMQDQDRRGDAADTRVGAELVVHQPTHRKDRVGALRDLGGGGERRLEDQPADLLLGGKRDGDTAAERLTPQREPLRRIAAGRITVGGRGIGDQPLLARRAGRAA